MNVGECFFLAFEDEARIRRTEHKLHDRADRASVARAGVVHGLLLFKQPPRGRVLAEVVAKVEVMTLEREIEIGLAVRKQVDGERARLGRAPDATEGKGQRTRSGSGHLEHFIEESLQ